LEIEDDIGHILLHIYILPPVTHFHKTHPYYFHTPTLLTSKLMKRNKFKLAISLQHS